MLAEIYHQDKLFQRVRLQYAGRTNVFKAAFKAPQVSKDYETLRVRVIASQADALNFGIHERTYKLVP